jgi:hypothetical protein
MRVNAAARGDFHCVSGWAREVMVGADLGGSQLASGARNQSNKPANGEIPFCCNMFNV